MHVRLLQTDCSIWKACWVLLSLVALCLLWYELCYLGLFVWGLSHSRIVHPYGDVTIAGERAANFDHCSALMAIEQWGFFSVQHLLDTGYPFIMVISEDPWHSHLLSSVSQLSCYYLVLRLRYVAAGILTPNLALAGPTLYNPLRHRRGCYLGIGEALYIFNICTEDLQFVMFVHVYSHIDLVFSGLIKRPVFFSCWFNCC